MPSSDLIIYVVTGAIVALALFVRFLRIGKAQRLRLGTLWIVPAVFVLLAGLIFSQFPPTGLGWLWVAAGLATGGAIGWQRGRFVEIGIDPGTRLLNQRSSPAALLFIPALALIRWALHAAVMLGDARWNLGATLVADIFIAFAIGVLSFYRIELYLRARRLLGGY